MAVCSLPQDVIEEILLYSIHLDLPTFDDQGSILFLGWLVFLKINRLWRETTLHSARAWARASTQIPRKFQLLASRSRDCNLHIELSSRIPALCLQYTDDYARLTSQADDNENSLILRPVPRIPRREGKILMETHLWKTLSSPVSLTHIGTLIVTPPYDVGLAATFLLIRASRETMPDLRYMQLVADGEHFSTVHYLQ